MTLSGAQPIAAAAARCYLTKYAMMTNRSLAPQARSASKVMARTAGTPRAAAGAAAQLTNVANCQRAVEILSQQDYLRAVKEELGMLWDELAVLAGISPRALKTYRLPDGSADHRGMPNLARRSIDQLVVDHRRKMARRRKN